MVVWKCNSEIRFSSCSPLVDCFVSSNPASLSALHSPRKCVFLDFVRDTQTALNTTLVGCVVLWDDFSVIWSARGAVRAKLTRLRNSTVTSLSKEPSPTAVAALRASYDAADQSQVFTFWDVLTSTEQSALFSQLSTINPAKVNGIYRTATAAADAETTAPTSADLAPPPLDSFGSVVSNPEKASEWSAVGLQAVKEGKVGVLLMAGGQGTRLGSSAPKGCYDIGLASRKSFFQIQAERIRKIALLAGAEKDVPWYIMTSGPTRGPTEEFFKTNDHFGLSENNVMFFEQGQSRLSSSFRAPTHVYDIGVLPCLDNDGKIFLDTPSRVAVAPDGNGGIYAGLRAPRSPSSSASVLSDLAARGIQYLHTYGVDNCLVRVADPIFLGYCIAKGADCGVKVVKKTVPEEAVGVVALKSGKWNVVEYSEIPVKVSESREEESGDLRFRAANIANHFYTLDFLNSVSTFEEEMAYHIARKKIPHTDLVTGQATKPTKPNGMKLELFVFDVFPFTKRMALLEVDRSTDFSPLKNAPGTGSDDPETSRRDLLAEHKRWLIEAGASIEQGVEIELSPLVSYAGEGLEAVKGKTLGQSGVVSSIEDFVSLSV